MTPTDEAHFIALWTQDLEAIMIEAWQQRPVLVPDDTEDDDKR